MTEIDEMYDRIYSIVEKIESTELIMGSEDSPGLNIGRDKSVSQIIEVEFNGSVPEDAKIDLLQAVNGTGWEFVDEDNVFQGDNSKGGLITVSRDVDPEKIPTINKFDQEDYF